MNCAMCCIYQLHVVHEMWWSRNIPLESEYCPLIVMQKSVRKDCNDVNAFVKRHWEGNISFISLHCLHNLSLYITLAIYQHFTSSICLKFLHLHTCTHAYTCVFSEREGEREQNQNSWHRDFIDWEPIILILL
jgi:hypothetical protein